MGQKHLSNTVYMITTGSLICICWHLAVFISTHMNLPYSLNCMICHCINESIYQTTTDKYFNCIQFVFVCGFWGFFFFCIINNAAIKVTDMQLGQILTTLQAGFLFQHWSKCISGLLLKQILTMLVITSARLPKEF